MATVRAPYSVPLRGGGEGGGLFSSGFDGFSGSFEGSIRVSLQGAVMLGGGAPVSGGCYG